MLIGIGSKLVDGVLLHKIVGQLHHLSKVVQLQTVIVGISKGELKDKTAHAGLLIIRGNVKRIFWNKDVGGNASTAIHLTTIARIISRATVLDAVL